MRVQAAVNVDEVRQIARRRLPRPIFEIIEGGAGDEATLASNVRDFSALALVPRALEPIDNIDLATTMLGQRVASPICLAPASFTRMADPSAEIGVARAADSRGVGYVVPGGASGSLDRIGEIHSGESPLWYQLYMRPQEETNLRHLESAKRAGVRALVVTIDTPVKPLRERDVRNRIALPLKITPRMIAMGITHPAWARRFLVGNRTTGYSMTAARRAYYDFADAMSLLRAVTVEDIKWLREKWEGPLVVKGVLSGHKMDVLRSIGVDGVVVSNHGGRNLDGTVSTIAALPGVVQAAGGQMEVYLDGGVRRGIDAIRALAMGARAVFVGRPYLYGLAAGGSRGVEHVIDILNTELRVAMAFMGLVRPSDVDFSAIATHRQVPIVS